jgi:hypothetical protein
VRKHRPKHVQPNWNNQLIYIVYLVGYFYSCITMQGFMNVKYYSITVHRAVCMKMNPRIRNVKKVSELKLKIKILILKNVHLFGCYFKMYKVLVSN